MTTGENNRSSFGDSDLQGAFDLGLEFGEFRASTPKIEQRFERFDPLASNTGNPLQSAENVVLRIDNVPWVYISVNSH